MKKKITNILTKTPLILRVVSLYVMLWPVGQYILDSSSPTMPPLSSIVVAESVSQVVPEEAKVTRGVARRIEIPRISLIKEVIDGEYSADRNEWTLTDDKVHYATMTPTINDHSGQTMLYGHNTSAVLEPVKLVQLGDELLITSENGAVFVYIYSRDRFVEPTDVSVFSETPERPSVVLMTCEGWFSETRRLLYFDFKEIR